MPSETYKQLRKEMVERNKKDSLNKKQVILLEQQITKDLPQKCAQCGRTDNLTLDHVVPKTILLDFGVDILTEIIEDNYQLLCRFCNRSKSHRLDLRLPKTKEILQRLIEKI